MEIVRRQKLVSALTALGPNVAFGSKNDLQHTSR
jgi:hypothetical protein